MAALERKCTLLAAPATIQLKLIKVHRLGEEYALADGNIADGTVIEYPASMRNITINCGRFMLREFAETDRAAFNFYQNDPRYSQLYDLADGPERSNQLFDMFLQWQQEQPRVNIQLAICEIATQRLLGCGGLRKKNVDVAILGLELAPSEWGRYRLALDASHALLRFGFENLNLAAIIGNTASGNHRIEKLAHWFGARIIARRPGPDWMQARGWDEVDWEICRETLEQETPPHA